MRTGYEEGWAHDNIQSRGPGPELFRCFYTAFPASAPARLGVAGEPVPFPTQYQSTNPRAFFSDVHVGPEVWNPTVANLTLLVPWLARVSACLEGHSVEGSGRDCVASATSYM